MKIFFFFLFLLSPAYGEGPLYRNSDRYTQLEFDNVYQDLRRKQNGIPLMTKVELQTFTPATANLLYICSDCTVTALVISTGTTRAAVGSATAKSTSIN